MNTHFDIQTKMSTLWIVTLLNMAYADILALYIPGVHDELLKFAGNTPISQLMLGGAVILELPILMIFLSRMLSYRLNRWLNIIVSILMIIFVIGPEIGNDSVKPHYLLIATVEIICLVSSIWIAWAWRITAQAETTLPKDRFNDDYER